MEHTEPGMFVVTAKGNNIEYLRYFARLETLTIDEPNIVKTVEEWINAGHLKPSDEGAVIVKIFRECECGKHVPMVTLEYFVKQPK